MTPFLEQVANHYYALTTAREDFCYIFPNRRSMLFFKKYFTQKVEADRRTIFEPEMYTINDFFYKVSHSEVTSRIDLLLSLYTCYCKYSKTPESLDEFVFWGDMILSDFNEVDKYAVDAKMLFTNVKEFKSMQDYSYFTEKQLEALKQLMANFSAGKNGQYKENFRKTWDILYPIYLDFNEKLRAEGKCYEGMVYKELASRFKEQSATDILLESFPETKRFVFIGLNAPSESEKIVLRKMQKAKIAEFCWDYSSEWIKDGHNKSSFFLQANIEEFPQSIELDTDGLPTPLINVLNVPSAVGQSKQLPAIFDYLKGDTIGLNTAVVLPDESLLLPTLNSLPADVDKVNITMGYPMSGSSIFTLIEKIFTLQLKLRKKDEEFYFYHRPASDIYANSLFKQVLSEEEQQRVSDISKQYKHYFTGSELHKCEDGILKTIFSPVIQDLKLADANQIDSLCEYFKDIITRIAQSLISKEVNDIELDFAKDFYLAIEELQKHKLAILPNTFFKLLKRLVGKSSIAFKGEPLEGLQIMGPLETRALDFENLIILSCNEGTFPRHNVGESFIPAEIRKGFDLPTYEYQDALWAYYFYRLIQRASNVWLIYSTGHSRALKSTEPSRYIKQLELHFNAKIKYYIANSSIENIAVDLEFEKTEEHINKIKSLSASSIQSYIKCPAMFFYSKVEGLKENKEVTEDLDSGMIGTVLHETMQSLYSIPKTNESWIIDRNYIKECLKNKPYLSIIEEKIKSQIKHDEISGRNLIYMFEIKKYVEAILKADLRKLESNGLEYFQIIDLELKVSDNIRGFNFIGYVDRIDSFQERTCRILDYKTGKVIPEDFELIGGTASKVFPRLDEKLDKWPKVALQLYIYHIIASKHPKLKGLQPEGCIYQTGKLCSNEMPKDLLPSPEFLDEMKLGLDYLLEELKNTSIPWRRTKNLTTCQNCNFKNICGR